MYEPKAAFNVLENLVLEIYRSSVDDIWEAPERRTFISGGRGLGKSVVLRELASRAEREDPPVQFIDGRKHIEAIETMDYLQQEVKREPVHCFFDDIDHLILMARLLMEKREFDNFIRMLLRFVTGFPGDKHLVVTSTLAPIRLNEVFYESMREDSSSKLRWSAYSLFLQSFHSFPLNPWQGDWRSVLTGIIDRHLGERIEETTLEVCQQVILELTGGHPSLFTSALSELKRVVTGERLRLIDRRLADVLKAKKVEDEIKLRATLSRHLEDQILDIGLSPVLLTIRSLRNSDRHHAFESLKSLAIKPGEPVEIPPDARKILQDQGLIYKDAETDKYVIPGAILRRAIEQEELQISEDERVEAKVSPSGTMPEQKIVEPTSVRIEPDPDTPSESGLLSVQDGMKRLEIAFSGGPWVILRILFEDPGKTFSLEELRKPPLTKEPAVRSAIQRLQAKLAKEGLQDVVRNIYGQGYRLGETPILRSLRPVETSTPTSES